VPLNSPISALVATADFNGDQIPDLVIAGQHGLSIYLGNGDGTFRSTGKLAAEGDVHALQVHDLNGDGVPDIVIALWLSKGEGELVIFPGKGDGSFGSQMSLQVGYTPSAIGIADFNLDGKLDLAVSSMGHLSVDVYLRQTQGPK
jgi:hypothetical protein